jgi:hypothetical protein
MAGRPRAGRNEQGAVLSFQPSAVSFEIKADCMRFTSEVFSMRFLREGLRVVRLHEIPVSREEERVFELRTDG